MKILSITDVHQTTSWKKAITEHLDEVDKIIFHGDYFDYHSGDEHLEGVLAAQNFQEIVELKKAYPDKVELLFGNHDFHYLTGVYPYSDWQGEYCDMFRGEILKAKEYLKIAVKFIEPGDGIWGDDPIVCSHAGITKTWFSELIMIEHLKKHLEFISLKDPVDIANEMFKEILYTEEPDSRYFELLSYFDFSAHDMSDNGQSRFQGPLWVRPEKLLDDAYYARNIVGHTATVSGKVMFLKQEAKNFFGDPVSNKVVLIDNDKHTNYYIYDTAQPPVFLSISEAYKVAKKERKEENDAKSKEGMRAAYMRELYGITKSVWRRGAAQLDEKDPEFWNKMEEFCRNESAKKVANESV